MTRVLDHVGIAVRSIQEALPFYQEALGLSTFHDEELSSQKVRVAFLKAGETSLELLEPTSDDGPVGKFLKSRGPGLHHLAFRVEDIRGDMLRLSSQGRAPLETQPRPGARSHQVCFLHPKHAQGVLVELVEGHGR
ncbi:MAG: methylmalonyl-CoA epimerase [Elusimicrobia bacterium]|nr:methylmalonyl-CoA epimerase [Elusimicrobiota bacterium]